MTDPTQTKSKELTVEEYKSLRRELLQLAASISRWQLVGFIAAGIGVAIALITSGWIVAASSLIVIAGCIFGVIHDLTSITRIAVYIQTFQEGHDTGAMWETRLQGIRGADIFNPLRAYMTPVLSLLWIGLLVSLFAGLLPVYTFVPVFDEELTWPIIIPFVWLVFWAFVRQSYRALGPDGFKDQTREAFYQSLRQPETKIK